MVPDPTVAVADRPPQNVVSVYTITSLMDSSKPASSLRTTNTQLHLMAAASPGGLCIMEPKFTPVGVNLAGNYARAGAANRSPTWGDGTPLTVGRGAVSPSDRSLRVAMSNNTAKATMAVASVCLPVLMSWGGHGFNNRGLFDFWGVCGFIDQGRLDFWGGHGLVLPPEAVAPLVVGLPVMPSILAIVWELLSAINAIPTQNSLGAEETKSIGD
jgi:hypothetical protein